MNYCTRKKKKKIPIISNVLYVLINGINIISSFFVWTKLVLCVCELCYEFFFNYDNWKLLLLSFGPSIYENWELQLLLFLPLSSRRIISSFNDLNSSFYYFFVKIRVRKIILPDSFVITVNKFDAGPSLPTRL